MSFSDPISDMLTRVRNAGNAGLDSVEMPHSKLKAEVARIMKNEGYIVDFMTVKSTGVHTSLKLFLKYDAQRKPVITGLKRISKPSLRKYVGSSDIPRVLGGMGVALLSTSTGILTGEEARRANVGGEVLCYIW